MTAMIDCLSLSLSLSLSLCVVCCGIQMEAAGVGGLFGSETLRLMSLSRPPPLLNERKLCAHPFLEIYRGQLIHYMSPLAKQGDFYVPEVRKAPKRAQEGEESEEDGRTDITGADSYSECSSMSHLLPSDSRDPSPVPSNTSSIRYRDGRRDRDSPELSGSEMDSGRSHRSSSASSFEELDLETDLTTPENSLTLSNPAEVKITTQEQVMVVGEE
uniref:Uncharacterized protein n=1 Tax=Astyanax mexicanus TaxID=7994 RepID=A0A3B1IJU8_ASTMX